MRKSVHVRIAILALMLAVSHVALISHVTAHFQPELEQCELCVSQAQLLGAIPSPDHFVPADAGLAHSRLESSACVVPVRHYPDCQQRAPPTLSP